jgi:hypothetical protein
LVVRVEHADGLQVRGADLLDGLEVVVAVVDEAMEVVFHLQELQPLADGVLEAILSISFGRKFIG